MKPVLPALPLLFLPAGDLAIDYTAKRTLEVTIETTVTSETTHFSMERDGEEVDTSRFGGGGSEFSREVVYTETVLAHKDGAPTTVKRSFETVAGTLTQARGEESIDTELDSPMEGVTLIIGLDDEGEVVASVEDGKAERSEMLIGHRLENLLHGLLPENGEGEDWEIDGDAIAALLLNDLEGALFPRPEVDEGGEGERGGGRGRGRGMRGGGGSGLSFLNGAEWDTELELTERTEDVDGVKCVVIEITLEAEGEMVERAGGGRGGRDVQFGSDALFGPRGTITFVESTFEVELTGELLFSIEERRPVKLELEGEFTQETVTERESERGNMKMERTQEGTIEHTITLTSEDA